MTPPRARFWRLQWLWNTDERIPGPVPKREGATRVYELRWTARTTLAPGLYGRTARIEGARAPTPAEARRMVQRQYREVHRGHRMAVRGMTVRRVRGRRP